MVRNALIVDTETTSLDPTTGKVIEVAAILYSVECQTTLAQFSSLVPAAENPAEKINRIPVAALAAVAALPDPNGTLKATLATMRSHADVIVAHNAEFDRAWFKGEWLNLPWLCSAFDFDWPAATREAGSLVNLALEHGIGIGSAHRALTDCQLIAALFDRMHFYGRDLQEMFARAMRPKAIFQSLQTFDQNDVAKAAGFKWNGETKKWTRRLAIEDAAALPFKTVQIGEVA